MAHRSIGQERLGFAVSSGSMASMDDLSRLIDWDRIADILGQVHASAKGEPAWPPLAMFKALLLSVWHDLSDVRLAEALDEDLHAQAKMAREFTLRRHHLGDNMKKTLGYWSAD